MTLRGGGVDPVRRSYAILGLKPGASLSAIRRRYRFLAQCWHPDRHVSDARNQAQAVQEMQRINDAYQVVVENLGAPRASGLQSQEAGRRLSRDEIEALANAIGSKSPAERMLTAVGWVGTTTEGLLAILFGLGLAMKLYLALLRGDLRESPELILLFALLGGLVFRELWLQSRLRR